jgi:hypothetical protein
MVERNVELYFGDEFGYFERYDYNQVLVWLAEGSVVEARKPTPTKKNADKYCTVYKWIGEKQQELRDLSAEMPPSVTEGNAEGSFIHRMIVKAWRPSFTVVTA